MTGISGAAKYGDLDEFCDDVKQFADSVCNLMENSAHVGFNNIALCNFCFLCN